MSLQWGVRIPWNQGSESEIWSFNTGQYLSPIALWEGTKWRIFAGGPGAPLKIRDSSGNWFTIATEGYQYARIKGRVFGDRTGLPIINRRIYFHQDFPVGTVFDNVNTDSGGYFDGRFCPFDTPIYARVFIYPNNFNYVNSRVFGPYMFTQDTQTQTLPNLVIPD